MRFAWLGVHAEGVPSLEALLAAGAPIRAVIALRPDLAAKRSAAADFSAVCDRYCVPLHYVANINDANARDLLGTLDLDVVFVIGWHQLVRPETLRLAKVGMVGTHAALLPRNRGSAPVNWALIHGERETGSTLLWLADDVDAGTIIDQTTIAISPYDTCATLYEQVAHTNRVMLLRLLPRLLAGERPGRPQPPATDPPLPRRRPAEGAIDWSQPSQAVYDFIRALTRPYPGAFSSLDGHRWFIWQAALMPPGIPSHASPPGDVLGPVVSPVPETCGQLVACGAGSVVLLELEADNGTVLRGRALSDQPWTHHRWLSS